MATMWEHITTIVNAEPRVFVFNAILLAFEGIAAGCVAAGIVWESAALNTWRHRVSHKFVIWGIVAEVVFSLALFISDEVVSGGQLLEIRGQQSKIIALEKQLAPRPFTKWQFDALQTLKGKLTAVNFMPEAASGPMRFSSLIEDAVMNAGVKVRIYFAPPGAFWQGIIICLPSDTADPMHHPLMEAFTAAGLLPGYCNLGALRGGSFPKNVPLIEVGERYRKFWTFPYFGPEFEKPANAQAGAEKAK